MLVSLASALISTMTFHGRADDLPRQFLISQSHWHHSVLNPRESA